jgi:hypothetical protein
MILFFLKKFSLPVIFAALTPQFSPCKAVMVSLFFITWEPVSWDVQDYVASCWLPIDIVLS